MHYDALGSPMKNRIAVPTGGARQYGTNRSSLFWLDTAGGLGAREEALSSDQPPVILLLTV